MWVVRVLNNNAVLASRRDGTKTVLFGKGIGFGKRLGDPVDMEQVTNTFVPDGSHPIGRLVGYLRDLPIEVVGYAHQAVQIARLRLSLQPSQALLLTLADHLHLALQRLDAEPVAYPLAWEVSQLYPAEMAAGREVVEYLSRKLGRPFPQEEAVAFALHFVNAQFADEDLSMTVSMTSRIRQVLSLVEAELGVPMDEDTMNVARFVTHLRYLFVRLAEGNQFDDGVISDDTDLRARFPNAWRAARRVRALLEMDGNQLTHGEVGYLTIHLARLSTAHRAAVAQGKPSE